VEVFIIHRMTNPFLSAIQAFGFYYLTHKETNDIIIIIQGSWLRYCISIKIFSFSQEGHCEN